MIALFTSAKRLSLTECHGSKATTRILLTVLTSFFIFAGTITHSVLKALIVVHFIYTTYFDLGVETECVINLQENAINKILT